MESTNHEALVGRVIAGKYVIETLLGGGAMGAVFKARQTALEKVVAIKVMHADLAKDANFAIRFHREAKAASRLDHPNSMRVVDFGEEPDGLLYIAMEYLEGRDLYKVIHEDWPLPEARIVDILSQALAALAVAHDMGVIHRDLKPENIMVLAGTNDEGHAVDVVKVCDFGIAKLVDADADSPGDDKKPGPAGPRATTQGLVIGTPEYMSPEQAQGKKLDLRSDLYSMGIILYQLLTGRVPFDGESAVTIVVKHVTQIPDPPRSVYVGVHPKLEAVCLKAVEKSPDARFSNAREMRSALRDALRGGVDGAQGGYAPPASVSMVAGTEPVLHAPSLGLAPTAAFMAPDAQGPVGTVPGAPLSQAQIAVAASATSATAAQPAVAAVAGGAAVAGVGEAGTQAIAPAPSNTSSMKLVLGFGVATVLAVGVAAFLAVKLELMGTKSVAVSPSSTPQSPPPSATLALLTASPSAAETNAPPPSPSPSTSALAMTGKTAKPLENPSGHVPGHPTADPASPLPGGGPAPSATTAPTAPPPTAAPTVAPTVAPTPVAPAPAPAPLRCSVASATPRAEGISSSDLQKVPNAASFASCAASMTANAKVTVRVMFDESGRRRGAPAVAGAGPATACFVNVGSSVAVRPHADLLGAPAVNIDVQVACQ